MLERVLLGKSQETLGVVLGNSFIWGEDGAYFSEMGSDPSGVFSPFILNVIPFNHINRYLLGIY